MAVGNINSLVRCDDCTFADETGKGCKHGLLFPVMVFMSGKDCPNFKFKNNEQIEAQLNYQRKEK